MASLMAAGDGAAAKAVSAMEQQLDQLHVAISQLEEESAMLRGRIEPVSRPVGLQTGDDKVKTPPEEMLSPIGTTVREMRKRVQVVAFTMRSAREQLEI